MYYPQGVLAACSDYRNQIDAGCFRHRPHRMYKLILHCSCLPGGSIEISPGQLPLVIGRSSAADLKIPDELLSRKHSELLWDDGGFIIRDLDSTNLTIVNEQDVQRHALQHGDVIFLGDTEIRVDVIKPEDDPSENTTRELTAIPPPENV